MLKATSSDSEHLPVTNRAVTVQVSSEVWKDGEMQLVPRGKYSVSVGPDGVTHLPIKAVGHDSLLFKAYVKDDAGRLTVAEDRVYVVGGHWDAQADQSRMDVTLDKRRYKQGDTAHVMLRTIAPGGSALVTVQTDTVLWKQVVPLNGNSTFVALPVLPQFLPNCFVNVAYVRKKKFYEGFTRLAVEPGQQKLKVVVESDKSKYQPGDTAKLTVHTLDSTGKPVPAEVSLGVVDESIYAIRPDDFNVFEAFYPKSDEFGDDELLLLGGVFGRRRQRWKQRCHPAQIPGYRRVDTKYRN